MRTRKVKFSLKYKIALLIFSLMLTVMGTIFSYSIQLNSDLHRREIRRSIKQVSDTLSTLRLVTSFTGKEEKSNWKIYEKYMEILARLDKNILMLAIKDKSGDIKAYTINRELIKKDFRELKYDEQGDKLIQQLIDTKLDYTIRVTSNIKVKGEQLSDIIIKFSKKAYNRKMTGDILILSLVLFVLLVAGSAGSWFLAHYVTNNFNIIAAGMRKVAGGNLDVAVEVKANDEVGVLADDFNRMLVELKEKVRIKGAFETVAEGLKDMDELKKAYKFFAYQEMTDKITKGYYPPVRGDGHKTVYIYIDIESFSNLSYELVSPEMKQIIEKFTEKIALTALEYQGAVFKVTDKFVLLSFGFPFTHDDDMKRALISTVEIRKELVSAVKAKLTLGHQVEDFTVNFVLIEGSVADNFVDKSSMEKYGLIKDYLGFASRYSGKKQYGTDIYAAREVVSGTQNLATYDRIDAVTTSDGHAVDIFKLKGTKF